MFYFSSHFFLSLIIVMQILLSPLISNVISQTHSSALFAQDKNAQPDSVDKTKVDFNDRLRYYLNENTHDVIQELLDRERQLLDLINNIHDEVALRGEKGLADEESGFKKVYGKSDSLIAEYNQEVGHLVKIYDELEHLKKLADYVGDVDNSMKVIDAKDQVLASIDNRELYKKRIYTPENIGEMVDEYTSELDSLLNIYDALEHLKVQADAAQDSTAIKSIRNQKAQLFVILSKWGNLGPLSEEDYLRFQTEMQKVHQTVKEIRNTQETQLGKKARDLRIAERGLVDNVDRAVYDLMTNSGYSLSMFPTVSEFIKAWKGERLLDIKTRLTEYQIIWKNFLNSANTDQRKRMFSSQLSDALLNYSNGHYRTAEYQLLDILKRYNTDYENLIPVKYYIAEARLHRNAFITAKKEFEEIVADSASSHYYVESLVRLMQLEKDFGTSAKFYKYYMMAVENQTLASGEIINYAHYLAANHKFEQNQFTRARDILALIPKPSEFYLPAQLLLGIIYTNLNDFDQAIPIFQALAKEKNYPWSDVKIAEIRNTASLRLGLIYYQRGNFVLAQQTLEDVSPGFKNHDEALIAQAWSKFRLNDYAGARDLAYQLLQTHLASDFSYEALVLSAHCNRILNNSETALDAYRYVVRARGVLTMKKKFDSERELMLEKTRELGRLQNDALDKRQPKMYSEISRITNQLNDFLLRTREKGDTGTQLLQDYYDERLDVLDRLVELDKIIQWAQKQRRADVMQRADALRERLMKVLEVYQGDKKVTNTAYLVDFPLAAKEANMIYRRESWGSAFRDMSRERQRIENALDQMKNYQTRLSGSDQLGSKMDLEILGFDIQNLQEHLGQVRKAMVENNYIEPKSNIDYWSDLSGFAMSDIIFKEREKKIEQIDTYANRLQVINDILRNRQKELMEKIDNYEAQLKELQDKFLSRKIKLEQLEKDQYFNNVYFDKNDREEESWEDRLRQLNEK